MIKTKRLYHQKYRSEWEQLPEFGRWLCKSNDGSSAHCKICDVNILSRLASIRQHKLTKKHQESLRCNEFHNIVTTDTIEEFEGFHAPLKKVKEDRSEVNNFIAHKKVKRNSEPEEQQFDNNMKIERETKLDNCSTDSILDDLLVPDDLEHHGSQHAEEEEEDGEEDAVETIEGINDDRSTQEQLNEFDFFGRGVAFQLNHMDLTDALICQERLQSVITEFRLKILKRERLSKINF